MRETPAEVAVIGVFERDQLTLPVGEPVGEGPVPGGQITDPMADLPGRLVEVHCELVALGLGGGLGFTGAQRREVLTGMAAAQLGVRGDGQLALGAGGLVPGGAVSHRLGEHGLALPVGLLQGVVADGQLALARGVVVVAAVFGAFPGAAGAGRAPALVMRRS